MIHHAKALRAKELKLMPFIKLDYADTECLIALLEDMKADPQGLSPQEEMTLNKLQMIRMSQRQKHLTNVRDSATQETKL